MTRGAIVLPRKVVDRDRGEANWPKCLLCRRGVDAYGIVRSGEFGIELWARCDGIARDPQSGGAVHGAAKVHETRYDSAVLPKSTPQQFTDRVRRLAFFGPDGDKELTPQ
jgi:hypothetical protein